MDSIIQVLRGLGALAAGVVILPEAFVLVGWSRQQSDLHGAALKVAQESKRPLLTINCPGCPGQNIDLKDLHVVPDRSFGAVFLAKGIENVRDIDSVVSDLYRVADKVFIAVFPKESLLWSIPQKPINIIHSAPPATSYIDYTDSTTGIRRKAVPTTLEG